MPKVIKNCLALLTIYPLFVSEGHKMAKVSYNHLNIVRLMMYNTVQCDLINNDAFKIIVQLSYDSLITSTNRKRAGSERWHQN